MASLFAFAGAGGGLVASVATCPLDVIKTKLQAQTVARGHAGYQGVLGRSDRKSCMLQQLRTARHAQDNHQVQWISWPLPWPRTHSPWLPPNMGDLFCSVRWDQDQIRGDTTRKRSASSQYLPRSTPKGLSADHARSPLVTSYSVCNDCRRLQHHLYKPLMGHKDPLHGLRLFLTFRDSLTDSTRQTRLSLLPKTDTAIPSMPS